MIALASWGSTHTFSWTQAPHILDKPARPHEKTRKPSKRDLTDHASNDHVPLLLGIGALVGFLVLGFEIVGSQFLWLVINATAYSEGMLFAAILIAMAVGSALYLIVRAHFRPTTLLILG